GLALDPGSQADLKRPMTRLERAGGQGFGILVGVMDGKDARLLGGDSDDDRGELDRDGGMIGFGQCSDIQVNNDPKTAAHYGTLEAFFLAPIMRLASATNFGIDCLIIAQSTAASRAK